MNNKTPTLAMLEAELLDALANHKAAEQQENEARRLITSATNRLNDAQKAIDEHLARLRETSPWNTRWREKKGRPVEVSA